MPPSQVNTHFTPLTLQQPAPSCHCPLSFFPVDIYLTQPHLMALDWIIQEERESRGQEGKEEGHQAGHIFTFQ